MATSIIVEVVPGPAGELPAELLTAVYRVSEERDVTLVLRGTTPAAVDRILDPTVNSGRRDVRGVRYLSASNGAEVAVAALTARFAICATDEFRAFMARSGVHCLEPGIAGESLRALTTPGVAVPRDFPTPFTTGAARQPTAQP